jgi:hypothetical protein
MKLPTNYIYSHFRFSVAPGGDFLRELLNEIVDVFAVVEPEYVNGDIELGEAVDLPCTDSDEGEWLFERGNGQDRVAFWLIFMDMCTTWLVFILQFQTFVLWYYFFCIARNERFGWKQML